MHAFSAFVLAAGLGTRLRPLTDERPKALVPVGDRTMLAHAVASAREAGATRVVANAHHHAAAVARAAAELGVGCSVEAVLLGTAGGLARAAGELGGGPVLVWNADILAELDGQALVARLAAAPSRERPACEAALAIRPRPAGEGNVGVDAEGLVVRLRHERMAGRGPEVAGGAFLGVHAIGPALRSALPPEGCLVGDLYLPALRRGAALAAVASDGAFFDVGTPAAYLEANLAWLARRGLARHVGPGARITAPCEGVVVGEGAVVEAALASSVVWPGARVDRAGARLVVTPSRRLAVDA